MANLSILSAVLFVFVVDPASAVFKPTNRADLFIAITACLSETPDGSCPLYANKDGNDVMGNWDTSEVTEMNGLFETKYHRPTNLFNADISKW